MKKEKSLPKLKAELWKWFSLFIKLKYSKDYEYCNCYTCGQRIKIGTLNCQAGHYYTKKGYSALYFDENNVRPQCYHCNINLSGNTVIFGEKLEQEIGSEEMNRLKEHRHDSIKLMKYDYLDLIDIYKIRIMDLRAE